MIYYFNILCLIIILGPFQAQAEVILDGSLGPQLELVGPQFDIQADFGRQMGNHLFHSFQSFNLNEGEIATFSGPEHINRIISRVTGGTESVINGTLRSTIPQADMYFLNPAGILFGEQAQLDIQGSMHFSTADELRLGEEGLFAISQPQNTLLTVAPPSAFGFLSDSPATIMIQGSQLTVSENQSLSVIGGPIDLQPNTLLQAAEGRLNLASVASKGQVIPSLTDLKLIDFEQRGSLTMNQAQLNVNGEGAGSIFIRAGQLLLTQSEILGITKGAEDGEQIDIAVEQLFLDQSRISTSTDGLGRGGDIILNVDNAVQLSGDSNPDQGLFANTREQAQGDAGTITLNAKSLDISEGGEIGSNSFGLGQGGAITLNVADQITLKGKIFADSYEGAKDAGIISIQTNRLNIVPGAVISSTTYGLGQGGDIELEVGQAIQLEGDIFALSFSEEPNAGNAGMISIQTGQLLLAKGAQINTVTLGAGKGGKINIYADDTVSVKGYTIDKETQEIFSTGIVAATLGSGDAGTIEIKTKHLNVEEGGGIGSFTYYNTGKGGEIIAEATDSIYISGSVPTTLTTTQEKERARGITSASQNGSLGPAGQIQLQTPLFILTNEGEISTSAEIAQAGQIQLNVAQLQINEQAAIISESQSTGNAGSIYIVATDYIDIENAKVSTQAAEAAGGNITIEVPNRLYLQQGQMTTSVKGGEGGGGDIEIKNPVFVVLDKAKVIAQAVGGDGGNIIIKANQFIATPKPTESIVDASSQKGIDGTIVIRAPNTDISGKLLVLNNSFLNVEDQLQTPCHARTSDNTSTFIVNKRKGLPFSPNDLLPSGLLVFEKHFLPTIEKVKTILNENESENKVALKSLFLIGCQPNAVSNLKKQGTQ